MTKKLIAAALLIAIGGLSACVAYEPAPAPQAYRDRDRDGIPNRADRDRDGDGVPNRYDNRPNNPRQVLD